MSWKWHQVKSKLWKKGQKNRIYYTDEWISEHIDGPFTNIHLMKKEWKNEERLKEVWDTIKGKNIQGIRVQEELDNVKGGQRYSKKKPTNFAKQREKYKCSGTGMLKVSQIQIDQANYV